MREARHATSTISHRTMATLIALALGCVSLAAGDAVSNPIAEYHFENDVSGFLDLALDLKAMDAILSSQEDDEETRFAQARNIYQYGAYADPYAELTISKGLDFDLPVGTVLTGTNHNGSPVTVTTVLNEYKQGVFQINVLFSSNGTPCRYSGIPEPELDGCLANVGQLRTTSGPHQAQPIDYTYYPKDNIHNIHKLQALSLNAQSKYKVNGNTHMEFFHDFARNVNFFGFPDFANQIVTAAFERSVYTAGDFVLDFTQLSPMGRRSVILHTAAYLIVTPFIMRELETALVHCDRHCTSVENCNHDALHALDAAVALSAGAIYQDDATPGNFLYGLAQHMCRAFRTCGKDGTSTSGTAHSNIALWNHFKDMKSNLKVNQCLEAKIQKEAIGKLLNVPLLQATLLAIHMDQQEDTMETRAERIVFTTSILPLLHHCDPAAAKSLIAQDETNVLEPIPETTFATVKSTLEDHYRCMGVTCLEIGGLWDPDQGTYVEGAETCYVPDDSSNTVDTLKGKIPLGEWYPYLLGVSVVGVIVICMMRRHQRRKRLLRDLQDDDSDSDDDLSLASEERPWA